VAAQGILQAAYLCDPEQQGTIKASRQFVRRRTTGGNSRAGR